MSRRKLKTIGHPPRWCEPPALEPRCPKTQKALRCGLCAVREKQKRDCAVNEKGLATMGNMTLPVLAGAEKVIEETYQSGQTGNLGEDWDFKIGQCISHRDQIMPSLVMTRVKTAKGHEVYGVRSFAVADPQRDRVMLGEVLVDVAPGDKPCEQCLLFRSSLCPGDLR